jgi:hypothetical protein
MSLRGVEDFLKLLMEVYEVVKDALENGQVLVHVVEESMDLDPFKIIEPVSWVRHLFDIAGGTSQEETPLIHVNLVVTEKNLCAEKQGEK